MRQLQLKELGRKSIEEFVHSPKIPVIAVLDNLRSLNNVGSFFRTADAFALEAVYLCGYTGTPPHPEIRKSALGAEDAVAWKKWETTSEAILALKSENTVVWAVEQTDQSIPLNTLQQFPAQRLAVVFGNEVHGVSPEVLSLVDGALEIPQEGTKHSLNVSVCAGVVFWKLFELYRK